MQTTLISRQAEIFKNQDLFLPRKKARQAEYAFYFYKWFKSDDQNKPYLIEKEL
jgi:hypothetical protein